MTIEECKRDVEAWCSEDRSAVARLPLLGYGIFLLWKTALHPELFTPIDWLDLGVHEMGHMIFLPFGQWLGVAGGSIAQLVAPAFGAWQFFRQRDYFAALFALGWLGESLANLSVYIGDARAQELPLANLFGGEPIHDWYFLLSSVNRLTADHAYSLRVRFLGVLFAALFVWQGSKFLWKMAFR